MRLYVSKSLVTECGFRLNILWAMYTNTLASKHLWTGDEGARLFRSTGFTDDKLARQRAGLQSFGANGADQRFHQDFAGALIILLHGGERGTREACRQNIIKANN